MDQYFQFQPLGPLAIAFVTIRWDNEISYARSVKRASDTLQLCCSNVLKTCGQHSVFIVQNMSGNLRVFYYYYKYKQTL